MAQWIELQLVNQKVTDSIPVQGTCLGCGPGAQLGCTRGNQLKFLSHIDVSLTHQCFSTSLSPSLLLSLK